jgi:hypothetical protein
VNLPQSNHYYGQTSGPHVEAYIPVTYANRSIETTGKYCYECGNEVGTQKYCDACGLRLNYE